MLDLESAIKHCEEVAERLESKNGYAYTDVACEECAAEHRQLAEWLEELQRLKEQQPCEDAISKASVFEILGNLMSIPYDFDRQITEKDVSESMDEIRALPPVTPEPYVPDINVGKMAEREE